jgi:hypothetical protein
MSQHQGAMKPAQKRRMGSGGRRDTTARRAAEKEGRESALPKESSRVHRRQMTSDVLPLRLRLPPDVVTRRRGRGRAGDTGPNALLLVASPEPLPLTPPLLLLGSVTVSVVPSVVMSGSNLLPGCVLDEKVVEFEGPAGAYGVTMVSSTSSPSSESERAVTKLPVRSEPASS